MSEAPDLVLEARDIVKTFPGVLALNGVHLELQRGEVHALLGENGAGKSTLMHILGGVQHQDSGQVFIEGHSVRFSSPHDAARHGVAVVFQELSLLPNLSVAENIFANRQPVARGGFIRSRQLYDQTCAMLERFDLHVNPMSLVRDLSIAEQQVIEILKALSLKPKVLILDEPTSSLTAVETALLFRNVRKLKEQGMSFIYISHHLPEVFETCDRVTVFRDGTYVMTSPVREMSEAQLVRAMVGRELVNMYGSRESEIGGELFRLEGGSRAGRFQDVNLWVRRGEIVGLAGLVGAGRTELGRAIFGAEPLDNGSLSLNGEQLRVRSPAQAIRKGIGYLTEDRKQQGLFLRMPIRENCIAPSLGAYAGRFGFLSERAIDAVAESSRTRLNIVAPSIRQQVRNLSGGNQQKVLLSMWMAIHPKLLIVDEPTRGVDVGAKSEIYALVRRLAANGIGILMISSDLLEVLGLSDRIVVMREGRVAGEFTATEATEEKIIACATGVGLE